MYEMARRLRLMARQGYQVPGGVHCVQPCECECMCDQRPGPLISVCLRIILCSKDDLAIDLS